MYWCFAAVRWRRPLKATKTLNENKHIGKYFWKEIFKAFKQSQEYSKALKYALESSSSLFTFLRRIILR